MYIRIRMFIRLKTLELLHVDYTSVYMITHVLDQRINEMLQYLGFIDVSFLSLQVIQLLLKCMSSFYT